MKHKARLSISRPTYGCGRESMQITIGDRAAGIEFIELEIGLSEFTKALTGQGNMDCVMEVRGLENVGKTIERDTIEFKMPNGDKYGKERKGEAIKAAVAHTPEGWIASEYYGSQGSFFTKDGDEWAKTSITRWVDKPNDKEPAGEIT